MKSYTFSSFDIVNYVISEVKLSEWSHKNSCWDPDKEFIASHIHSYLSNTVYL